MATNTSYLGLTKPAQSDLYNVDVFNDNADAVDTNAQKTAANLATIEAVATASKPYVVGEYLVLKGILYKVTQAIANGGALVVGTNIAQDSVGTELKSIKESLSPSTYTVSTSLAIDCTIVKSGNVKSLIFSTGVGHSYTNGQFTVVGTISDANFRPTTTVKAISMGVANKLYQLAVTDQGVIQVWNYGATGAISAAMTLTYI